MTTERPLAERRTVEEHDRDDLVGVAGLGVLGTDRNDHERERTAERLATAGPETTENNPMPDSGPTVEPGRNGDDAAGPSVGSLSRRGALAALASVGLLGAGSQPVLAAQDGDPLEFGGNYEGASSSDYCLRLQETSSSADWALRALVDSTSGQAISGVAESTTGNTFGVNGVAKSQGGVGVRGKATATSGTTFGVLGVADSPDGKALQGTNFAESGTAIGLEGRSDSTSGVAVRGRARAETGQTTGVLGRTVSTYEGATGVEGEATSSNGNTTGVKGTNDSQTDGATGVHGETTTDGQDNTYGVRGTAQSTSLDAAGVKGEAPNGATGVMGLTATSSQATRSNVAGVYGETGSDSEYGVFGMNTATSGTDAHGVHGETNSPDSPAITGNNTAGGVGVESDGDLNVTGHVDVDKVGAAAHLSADQDISTGTATKVAFKSTGVDHFTGFDDTNNKYTIQEPGHYDVSFTIDWQTTFGNGDDITYELRINGSSAEGIYADTTTGTSGQKICRNFGRTLFDLNKGDDIEVFVTQGSGSKATIESDNVQTNLTIHKIG